MASIVDNPFLLFVVSFLGLLAAAKAGAALSTRLRSIAVGERQDLSVVLTATVTFLALIIGFTFSMVVSHYDQRMRNEEREADAIGTEYSRASLLSAADAAQIRETLLLYLDERIRFYKTRDARPLQQIAASTSRLQSQLWSAASDAGEKSSSPVTALAVSGMNDVLTSEGYAEAAWSDRLPLLAWSLMAVIAIYSNFLFGLGSHHSRLFVFVLLPFAVSISFFLIADIDSPRQGLIRVPPRNLLSLSQSLPSQ
jgi:hypothetical protein